MNRSFYLILVLGLLTTALSGCGRSWPHAAAGVAVSAHEPAKDNVSVAGRPADDAAPLRFDAEVHLGSVFPSEVQWIGAGYVFAHLRQMPDGSKSAGTLVFDPSEQRILWHQRGEASELTEWVGSTMTRLIVRRRTGTQDHLTLVTQDLKSGHPLGQLTLAPGDGVLGIHDESASISVWHQGSQSIRSHSIDAYGLRWSLPIGSDVPPTLFKANESFIAVGSRGAIRFHPDTGRVSWKSTPTMLRTPLVTSHEGEELAWLTDHNTIQLINLSSGETVSTSAALKSEPSWTHIQRVASRWILRGEWTTQTFIPQQTIVSLDETLRHRWQTDSIISTTSNIVSNGTMLFMADAHTTLAMHIDTGKIQWLRRISDSGEGYPMVARLTDTGVLFEGELVIAKLNPETGIPIWQRGINPLGLNLDVQSLKGSEETLRQILKVEATDYAGVTRGLNMHAMNLQRQATTLNRQADQAWSEGRGSRSIRLRNQVRSSSAMSRAISFGSLATSGLLTSLQMQEAAIREERVTDLGFRLAARQAIIRHAPNAYSRHHTFRASNTSTGGGITLIDLRDGTRQIIPTGKDLRGIGLLNLVDCDRGIVIHFGNSQRHTRPKSELFQIDTHLRSGTVSCSLPAGDDKVSSRLQSP